MKGAQRLKGKRYAEKQSGGLFFKDKLPV